MLSHILANDPRMGYAHQTNLIGPAQVNGQDYGYTLLTLLNNMLSQYNTYYNASAPLSQMTDVISAQTLGEQGAWTTALAGGKVTATETNGVVTVTNGGQAVGIPVTVPTGTTVNGAAFGSAYGGTLSSWSPLASGASADPHPGTGRPGLHQQHHGDLDRRRRLQHHGAHHRDPDRGDHRDRRPADRPELRRQR